KGVVDPPPSKKRWLIATADNPQSGYVLVPDQGFVLDSNQQYVNDPSPGEGVPAVQSNDSYLADPVTKENVNFPKGDVWVLRYHEWEIDDGKPDTAHTDKACAAGLDCFINVETWDSNGVVVWYGGHIVHSPKNDPAHIHAHWVRPRLE